MYFLITAKYTTCPSTMVYSYDVQNSTRSCRCHSDPDFTCAVTFEPVDGCVCAPGTYLDEGGKCVPPAKCSCYFKGSVIPPGEVISKDGAMWLAMFKQLTKPNLLFVITPVENDR